MGVPEWHIYTSWTTLPLPPSLEWWAGSQHAQSPPGGHCAGLQMNNWMVTSFSSCWYFTAVHRSFCSWQHCVTLSPPDCWGGGQLWWVHRSAHNRCVLQCILHSVVDNIFVLIHKKLHLVTISRLSFSWSKIRPFPHQWQCVCFLRHHTVSFSKDVFSQGAVN